MTTTKAPEEMNAQEALTAYGFAANGDGLWVPKTGIPTQAWKQTEGGWIRLDPPTAPIGTPDGGADPTAGKPWGRTLPDTIWIQVPWKQTEEFATASGLHPEMHPMCFEWVWPDAVVAEIYAYGRTADFGRRWKRTDEGKLVQDRSPEHPPAEAEAPKE